MTTRPGYISDGAENWIQIGPAVPVGSTVYYQTSEPSTPSTGDIWIDADGDVPSIDNSQFLRWKKTVSGGETSLSGLDDSGLSLQYTPAYEQVYLNGVLLVRGQDYTATTGTSITGLTALAASDVVEVFSVVARVVGDVYTQSQTNSLLDTKSNVSSTGLVLLNSTTFTGASSVSVSNIFNSTYENYRILLNITSATATATTNLRLRSGSTDNSSSNYYWNRVYGQTNVIGGNGASSADTNGTYFSEYNAGTSSTDAIIYNPFASKVTSWTGLVNFIYGTTNHTMMISGQMSVSTSYDGFTLYQSSGNMTGTLKVYGFK